MTASGRHEAGGGGEANPWQTLTSRSVYSNAWITVREDQVIRPDGEPGIYGVVDFRHWAIGVVPLGADGETVLVGQYRYPLGLYSWEIPEGGGDRALPPVEGAVRELAEETGLRAGCWTYLGKLHTSNSVCDETGFLFLAEELVQGEAAPEGTERLAIRRLPLEEAVRMASTGEITDSLAVVGLLRTDAYLRSGRTLRFS